MTIVMHLTSHPASHQQVGVELIAPSCSPNVVWAHFGRAAHVGIFHTGVEFLAGMSGLQYLSLRECKNVNGLAFRESKAFASLSSLNMNGCSAFSIEGMYHTLNHVWRRAIVTVHGLHNCCFQITRNSWGSRQYQVCMQEAWQ